MLLLRDSLYGHINAYIVERIGSQGYSLAQISNPYHRLTMGKEGIAYKTGPVGVNNLFSIDSVSISDNCSGSKQLYAMSVNGNKKENTERRYLSVCKDGSFAICASESINSNGVSSFFERVLIAEAPVLGSFSHYFEESVEPACPLKQWHIRRFINEGYMHLPSIVDKSYISECVRYLDHHLGKPGAIVPGGVQTCESLGKFEGHLSNSAAVRDVFKQTERILDVLFGADGYDKANVSGQIAYRFPELHNLPLTEKNKLQVASSTGRSEAYLNLLYYSDVCCFL